MCHRFSNTCIWLSTSLFLVHLCVFPRTLKGEAREQQALRGLVVDSKGNGLGGMRVTLVSLSDDVPIAMAGDTAAAKSVSDKNNGQDILHQVHVLALPYHVAYTQFGKSDRDKQLGTFEFKLPPFRSVGLRVSGRGCLPYETMIEKESLISEPLVIRVPVGLNSIPEFSLEQAQLYLRPEDQEKIERYLLKGDIDAAHHFIRRQIKTRHSQNWGFRFAGHILLALGQAERAKTSFELGDSLMYGNIMGDRAFLAGDLDAALNYYRESEDGISKADHLYKMGELFEWREKNRQKALECFQQAYRIYSRRSGYQLLDKPAWLIQQRVNWQKKLAGLGEGIPQRDEKLVRLLRKAAHYSRELSLRAGHYFCIETKRDRVFLSERIYQKELEAYPLVYDEWAENIDPRPFALITQTDLQVVALDDGSQKEERKLLRTIDPSAHSGLMPHLYVREKNTRGAYTNLFPSSKYRAMPFNVPIRGYEFSMEAFAPSTIIGEEAQDRYHYRVLGEERLFDQDAVLLEVVPREVSAYVFSMARIWINKDKGSVLKIEWMNPPVPTRIEMTRRGRIVDLEPRVKNITEFGYEKNGFWYPSRNLLLEYYVDSREQVRWVHVETDAVYEDYQFFGVASKYSVEGFVQEK